MIFPETEIEQATLHIEEGGDKEFGTKAKLQHFYLDADAGMLFAADGFILAGVETETHEGDESGVVPFDLCEKSKVGKVRDIQVKEKCVIADGNVIETDGWTNPYTILREPLECNAGMMPDLSIDAALLMRLARAICPGDDEQKPINIWLGDRYAAPTLVKPINGSAVGLIMPLHGEAGNKDLLDKKAVLSKLRDKLISYRYQDSVVIDGQLLKDLKKMLGVLAIS